MYYWSFKDFNNKNKVKIMCVDNKGVIFSSIGFILSLVNETSGFVEITGDDNFFIALMINKKIKFGITWESLEESKIKHLDENENETSESIALVNDFIIFVESTLL